MRLPATAKWIGLALLGLLVAGAVALAASHLTSQQIGIASESISAGDKLAPAVRSAGKTAGAKHGHTGTTPAPTAPTAPPTTPTTTTTPPPPPSTTTTEPPPSTIPAPPGESGDDHGGSEGGGGGADD